LIGIVERYNQARVGTAVVRLSGKIREYMADQAREFQELTDPAAFQRYTRVETELEEDIRSKAKKGDFTWTADFVPWEP
jgi:hypothetical protein